MTNKKEETSGWAIQDAAGKILVPTVGPSQRSAMVNWLVAYAGTMIYNTWPNEVITSKFEKIATKEKVSLIEVRISKRV